MPAIAAGSKVLVSGANGFVAVWITRRLLERGYTVRGAVRAERKGAYLKQLFGKYGEKFEIVVVPDITQPGAFDDAVKGVDAIEHTASPIIFTVDDPNELIGPAVKGTVGVLESALKYGSTVKRIVVLSSTASIINNAEEGVYNEENWNTVNPKEVEELGHKATQFAKYRASKTLAEHAAWEFVEKNKTGLKWDLVTLCPPFIYGPVLHEVSSPEDLNVSVLQFYDTVLKGAGTPEHLATFQSSWVDVRDIADAHINAIEREQAGGQRFIVSAGNFVWQDWFDAANALNFEGLAVPKGNPGYGVHLKFRQVYDSKRAREVLGIHFRDKSATAKDIIVDFKGRGWLPRA